MKKQSYFNMTTLVNLTTLVLASLAVTSCQKKQPLPERPNVLFILADDLGYYDLSCMGSEYYETPHIDRIANEGVVFTNGYATCQVCSPSRASIMTGQFPARHGITDWIGARAGEDWRKANRFNKLLPAEYVRELPAAANTLPEAMREGGYKTFFAGKWHLGSKGSWPEDHGFDINVGGWDSGGPRGGYFSPWENPNLENRTPGENLSMRLANETVRFLKDNLPEKTGQPVFAFLSFYAVHGPIQTTQEKWAKYRQKAEQMGIAPTGFKMGRYLPIRQVQDNPIYGGLVSAMDDAVGVVLNALDSLGLAENTIVIFTSDNGGVSAGDSFSTSVLPFRGGKGYQFEGGIREPYFIKVPGLTENLKDIQTPATGTDFYPTLLDLAGQPLRPGDHADGKSLLPLLRGETLPERPLIWHYPHYGNQGGEPSSIIRLGDWKLIHYYEDDREELYQLADDPYESNNVAANQTEKVEELHTLLFEYLEETDAVFPQKDPQYDPEKEQKYLEQVKTKRLPQLEKQRLKYLSEDFDPGNNWWGSENGITSTQSTAH
ncbi:MAG TPA: sulfatase [Anseongella sp.]